MVNSSQLIMVDDGLSRRARRGTTPYAGASKLSTYPHVSHVDLQGWLEGIAEEPQTIGWTVNDPSNVATEYVPTGSLCQQHREKNMF